MTDFIQIHFLTAYPASCLVRDDTGQPKTMMYGSARRGRISSASLKRAIRVSDLFADKLNGHLGWRTQRLGVEIDKALAAETDLNEEARREIAREIAKTFGKNKGKGDKDPLEIEQLAFVAPEERDAATAIATAWARGEIEETDAKEKLDSIILESVKAVDIALFGRMFADRAERRMDAAAAVAHPFTVDRAEPEADYYVAVDDLNRREEDAGAAFIGEQGFLSGLFYGYATIDRDLLVRNLGGDADLANRGIAAFVEGLAKVSPTGKKASFASYANASYLRCERGGDAPRSLAAAFLKPVDAADMLNEAVTVLRQTAEGFEQAYGGALKTVEMLVGDAGDTGNTGTLADVIALTQGSADGG